MEWLLVFVVWWDVSASFAGEGRLLIVSGCFTVFYLAVCFDVDQLLFLRLACLVIFLVFSS